MHETTIRQPIPKHLYHQPKFVEDETAPSIITNSDLINNYIDFGSPLNQVMLIMAMDQYTKHILANENDVREQMTDSLVHPEAWLESARAWIKAKAEQIENNNS